MELPEFVTSIAEHYHEETKYSEERLRRDAAQRPAPDPARRPVPWKRFDEPGLVLPVEGLPIRRRETEAPVGDAQLAAIARILWHTNGCTRVLHFPGGLQPFRAAPSAGAMYPTEVYVALRGYAGVPDGIYNYQILEHRLALVRREDPGAALKQALFDHPAAAARAAVILTGEWRRSSWRYRERAYRRCLLDTGHVLGNLVEIAPEEGFAALPFGCFVDGVVERRLGVDPADEGVLVVVPLVPAADAANLPPPSARRSGTAPWRSAQAMVATRIPAGDPDRLIAALHVASRLDAGAEPAGAPGPTSPDPPGAADRAVPLASPTRFRAGGDSVGEVIRVRRSTRSFDGSVPTPVAPVLRALSHSAPPSELAPGLLRTWFLSLNMEGLPPGAYAVRSSPPALVLAEEGEFATDLARIGLGQQIFNSPAAAIVHTVDLPRALDLYGDRAYRLFTLDAGHVGERLALALIREGLGASGCGGYLDDDLSRLLRLPESHAVVYLTVLGRSADPDEDD